MNNGQVYNPDCSLPEKCVHASKYEHDKDRHLQAQYGIRLTDFLQLVEDQNSQCFICGDTHLRFDFKIFEADTIPFNTISKGKRSFYLLCKTCSSRIAGVEWFIESKLFDKVKELLLLD